MQDFNLKDRESLNSSYSKWERYSILLKYLNKQSAWLVFSIFIILGASLANVGMPFFIARAIDNIFPYMKWNDFYLTSLCLVGLICLSLIFGFIQSYLLGRISQSFLFRLRRDLFKKIQELPHDFFRQNKTGDLLSRLNNDSNKIAQFFSSGISRIFSNVFSLMGIIIFVGILSPFLTVGLVIFGLGTIWLTTKLSKLSRRFSKESLETSGDFSSLVSENLASFKAVILFDKKNSFLDELNRSNQKNAVAGFKRSFCASIFSFIYGVLGNLSQVLLLFLSLVLISFTSLTVGVMVSFITYTQKFYSSLGQLGSVWGEAQLAFSAWDRISTILFIEEKSYFVFEKEESFSETDSSLLTLKNVTFGYKKNSPILNKVNLSFEKNKTYAIIGPTGGGKSTLAILISRLVSPWSGSILLEGKDLRSFNSFELSQKVGMILQDPFLFEGTIADNLRYANPFLESLGNHALELRLKEMNLFDLIAPLGSNLDLFLKDGSDSLSLGQKQLISFIRAVLREPEVLILDEATANIDPAMEKVLEDILESLHKRMTQIVIAHRLSTIKRADEVIFINSPNVISGLSYQEAVELMEKSKVMS